MFGINASYFTTSLVERTIPLGGTTASNTGFTGVGQPFIPPNAGRLLSITYFSTLAPGLTRFRMRDGSGAQIARKDFTISSGNVFTYMDFTENLFSGTNEFDGKNIISITADPPAGPGQGDVNAFVLFEIYK